MALHTRWQEINQRMTKLNQDGFTLNTVIASIIVAILRGSDHHQLSHRCRELALCSPGRPRKHRFWPGIVG